MESENEVQRWLEERMRRLSDEGNDELRKWHLGKAWGSFYQRDSYKEDRMKAGNKFNRLSLKHGECGESDVSLGG